MARLKIILEDGETQHEAEEMIFKAMGSHASGEIHEENKFDDPAVQDIAEHAEAIHAQIYAEMIAEIAEALDEDYRGAHGNF